MTNAKFWDFYDLDAQAQERARAYSLNRLNLKEHRQNVQQANGDAVSVLNEHAARHPYYTEDGEPIPPAIGRHCARAERRRQHRSTRKSKRETVPA